MSPTARRLIPSIALVALVPLAMPAQTATETQTLAPVRTTASIGNARADTLEARATALLRNTSRWAEAARLQRTAAELRGDDPRAVESFTRAAWMYGGARRLTPARQMMERAASSL